MFPDRNGEAIFAFSAVSEPPIPANGGNGLRVSVSSAAAKTILRAMNFDDRCRVHIT
jgi:hypothetical protein